MQKEVADKQPHTQLVIHWLRFGPYHIARLHAAFRELKRSQVNVVALETTSRDEIYQWRPENETTEFERYVALPGSSYQQATLPEIWQGIWRQLNYLNPHVVAVAGYNSPDAWSILTWCRLHRRSAILMSESKHDDAPRVWWKEWFKRQLVRQFAAALCGGTPQKSYLQQLGLQSVQIFTGYDVVDNDYFWHGAKQARQNPAAFEDLTGLENSTPFFLASARFIKRKNLDGLLIAYSKYRRRVIEMDCRNTPWRLVILGDGTECESLQKLAASMEIVGVSWPGFQQIEKLPAYYGLAGTFIHPPLQEQWGLVVNEAMAAGLPVLVSNRCGCAPDLVIDGVNGYTFDPYDVEQMADRMLEVHRRQDVLPDMGQASREIISHWGTDRFAQGLWQAIRAAKGVR